MSCENVSPGKTILAGFTIPGRGQLYFYRAVVERRLDMSSVPRIAAVVQYVDSELLEVALLAGDIYCERTFAKTRIASFGRLGAFI